jgi:hypothetical protein
MIQEVILSRVINPDSAGKQRSRLVRLIALTVRELLRQPEPNDETRDMAVFIILSLDSISDSIDPSVEAWEKRGYWVKADRFRMEWTWAKKMADQMREALLVEDWGAVAICAVQIAQQPQIASIKISPKHRMGMPWGDAWYRFKEQGS